MTKRLLEKDETEPFRLLGDDPLVRPLLKELYQFPIDELPVEVIMRIVYDHLNIFLAVFQLNTRLSAIQEMKGFWSGLFKVGYPEEALTLAAFLQESPDLTRLSKESITDILVLTTDFDSVEIADKFRTGNNDRYVKPSLTKIELSLLNGVLSELDLLYILDTNPDGVNVVLDTGRYPFDIESTTTNDFTRRKYLIKLYLLLEETQFEGFLDKTLVFRKAMKRMSTHGYIVGQNSLHNLMIDWIETFREQKPERFRRYAVELERLAEACDNEYNESILPDANTGQPPDNRRYFLTLDEDFKNYFGLTDEENSAHWKKLYIQTRKMYNPLQLRCTTCVYGDTLIHDKKLDILFCGVTCQRWFYTTFS